MPGIWRHKSKSNFCMKNGSSEKRTHASMARLSRDNISFTGLN